METTRTLFQGGNRLCASNLPSIPLKVNSRDRLADGPRFSEDTGCWFAITPLPAYAIGLSCACTESLGLSSAFFLTRARSRVPCSFSPTTSHVSLPPISPNGIASLVFPRRKFAGSRDGDLAGIRHRQISFEFPGGTVMRLFKKFPSRSAISKVADTHFSATIESKSLSIFL